jgi:UDP-N-acetylmuramoyl-tripeptide--D-alanyl-D-alanine ligase
MELTVRELTSLMKGQLVLGEPRAVAKRAVVDSRSVGAGDLFFALKGARVDGHQFTMNACRQGATGVVVSQLEWLKSNSAFSSAVIRVNDVPEALRFLGQSLRSSFKGTVIGITGSNGKTTVKQMTASIMKTQGQGFSTPGNFNSQIGLPAALSELKRDDRWMVLEMGASEPGNIASLADIAHPTIGVITSIGPAHLASFGSLAAIARTKWELMESLPADGTAVVPWGVAILEPHIRQFSKKIVFFGDNPSCPVRASGIETSLNVSFMLHIGSHSVNVRLPVPGRFNVYNALAAAAAGWAAGVSIEQIRLGLERFEPAKMRMEVLKHRSGATIVNDAYNANPASMLESVRTATETFPGKKMILVLGSMLELGDDSDKLHFHLGSEIGRFPLEHIFLYGKETEPVREGALAAGIAQSKVDLVASHEDLFQKLSGRIDSDTVVLFKGSRGMTLEKVIRSLETA